jgi:hypothetical protein
MMKTAVLFGTLIIATSAFAQSDTKNGATRYAPGQRMQQPNAKDTAPGASEYAPGHQKNTTAGPGHSESAPGQRATTGSSMGSSTTRR